jgi:hypothetical protein
MSGRCSACHKDIGELTRQQEGYHGSSTVRDTPCAACHPDHAGESFGMIKWPGGSQVRFDHRQAGWALEQSHERWLVQCHNAKYRTAPAAVGAEDGAGGSGEHRLRLCHRISSGLGEDADATTLGMGGRPRFSTTPGLSAPASMT